MVRGIGTMGASGLGLTLALMAGQSINQRRHIAIGAPDLDLEPEQRDPPREPAETPPPPPPRRPSRSDLAALDAAVSKRDRKNAERYWAAHRSLPQGFRPVEHNEPIGPSPEASMTEDGPFELLIGGRVVMAFWGFVPTPGGGQAWGWLTAKGLRGYYTPDGWRRVAV